MSTAGFDFYYGLDGGDFHACTQGDFPEVFFSQCEDGVGWLSEPVVQERSVRYFQGSLTRGWCRRH